jgi:tetratricopeptide (TPR) repeat protein
MQPRKPNPSAPSAGPGLVSLLTKPVTIGLALAIATLIVYWPVTRHDFVNLDDQVYVSECPQVLTGFTWENLRWAFTATDGGAWHPITWLSLMLDGHLFGNRPAGYHLTNLLWHVANTLLLFGWLYQTTSARWRSAIVAALFALHPLHVESVAWVSERKDVVSTGFWLLTLWTYSTYAKQQAVPKSQRSSTRWRWYALTLVLFALGLMSKPMLVTLPFVLLLLDFWPLGRFVPVSTPTFRRLFGEKIPFFLLSLGASVAAIYTQRASNAVASLDWISPGARVANAFVSYARYLGKTFWPDDLAVFYPHPTSWPLLAVLAAAALLVIVSAVVVRCSQRQPFLTVGWFWFVGTLVPVIGLVQVGGQSLADRYTYVPLIGLFIGLVWSVNALFNPSQRSLNSSPSLAIGAGLVLLVCAGLTIRQMRHWRNSETLFRHTLAVTQNNAIAHVNLASTLLDQNRFAEAAEQCQLALQIRPDSPEALKNLGLAFAGSGRWDEAITQYERALQINPKDDKALNSLGLALANQGKLAAAEAFFRRALESKAGSVEALSNLGLALALQGRMEEAMNCYQRALTINPREVKVLNNLGLALASLQRWDEALDYYRRALVLNPEYLDALVNSGAALASQEKFPEAITNYRRALQIKPDSLEALFNLGVTLASQGQRAEAIKYLSEARLLQPDNPAIQEQLRALGAAAER